MSIAILYREELKEYDFGPGHPFHGERYELFPRFLRQNLAEMTTTGFSRRIGRVMKTSS